MEGPLGSLDITACRHRHSHIRREVGATVDPPRARHDHLDTIGGIAVRRAEPARVPFHQDKVGAFSALDPFFDIVRQGLAGLVDGDHYFDTIAPDAVFEFRYRFPGWP